MRSRKQETSARVCVSSFQARSRNSVFCVYVLVEGAVHFRSVTRASLSLAVIPRQKMQRANPRELAPADGWHGQARQAGRRHVHHPVPHRPSPSHLIHGWDALDIRFQQRRAPARRVKDCVPWMNCWTMFPEPSRVSTILWPSYKYTTVASKSPEFVTTFLIRRARGVEYGERYAGRAEVGSVNVKHEPRSGCDAADIDPPIIWASPWAMANPRPAA